MLMLLVKTGRARLWRLGADLYFQGLNVSNRWRLVAEVVSCKCDGILPGAVWSEAWKLTVLIYGCNPYTAGGGRRKLQGEVA